MAHPFNDVPADAYFADAVAWAYENGITVGTSPTTFSPNDPVTRAQVVTFLHRYHKFVMDEVAGIVNPLDGQMVVHRLNDLDDRVAALELAPEPDVEPEPTPTPGPEPVPEQPPAPDGRAVVDASAMIDRVVLDQPNTIYDFGFVPAFRDITIAADGVEARNIRGPGPRQIGVQDGVTRSNLGFRDVEGTSASFQHRNGADLIEPFLIGFVDVNDQPHDADGDIIQVFAFEGGRIVRPLVEDCVAFGKRRPKGSSAHNDTLQITGIAGGSVVDPTIRGCRLEGASSAALQLAMIEGTLTIEDCVLSERFGSFHAVIAKKVSSARVLWRNNTMVDGASAVFKTGWSLHPHSTNADQVQFI